MKIKYLTVEDRRNLRLLKHTTDSELIASVLESIFRREYTLQALWEYRKWFFELPDEQYEKRPSLICGVIQLYILAGQFEKAWDALGRLPEGSSYRLISEMLMPSVSNERVFEIAQQIVDNGWAITNLTLTAGRPYVLNGIWDFSPSVRQLQNERERMLGLINGLYDNAHEAIYDIMLAESMYWRDQTYEALVLLVSTIPLLREKQLLRVLFAALTFEIFILTVNGQSNNAQSLIANLRQQIISNELEEYIPNIDALEVWAAMFDGDYIKVNSWLKDGAPDEHSELCLLDLFRYSIKMRAYIIQGKYMLVTALAGKLIPLCEKGSRYMDSCELYGLLAMSEYAAGRTDEALQHIGSALKLAEQYEYYRLLADEGQLMLSVLKLYRKQYGRSDFLDKVIELTQKTADIHPKYLKSQLPENPSLTPTELKVLRLLAEEYTNAQIASVMEVAVDTVKQHCKHICRKLEVQNRHQAVKTAVDLGVL